MIINRERVVILTHVVVLLQSTVILGVVVHRARRRSEFPPPPPMENRHKYLFLTLRTRIKTLLPSAQNKEYILKTNVLQYWHQQIPFERPPDDRARVHRVRFTRPKPPQSWTSSRDF